MNATEQAILIDTEIREWEQRYNSQFCRLGDLLLTVKVQEFWRHLNFHSFDEWLLDAMPCSRSTGYAALQVAQRLAFVPISEREAISPGNLKTLAEINDKKVVLSRPILDAAREKKPREFREFMAKEFPYQHIEEQRPMKFTPTASQRERIDESIALCIELGDADTREEALECFAASYWQENVYRRIQRPKAESAARVN